MTNTSSSMVSGAPLRSGRPAVEIHELEGVTILSAQLIVDEDGKDALVLDGDDGSLIKVNVRQPPGAEAFLEVSGENLLAHDEDRSGDTDVKRAQGESTGP